MMWSFGRQHPFEYVQITHVVISCILCSSFKYRYESNYPDLLWQHILRRGPNTDRWGFVTHSVGKTCSEEVCFLFHMCHPSNNPA